MSIKEQEYWKFDSHVHAASGKKDCDAKRNTPENLGKAFEFLRNIGDINSIAILRHEGFPVKAFEYLRKRLDFDAIVGCELTLKSDVFLKYPKTWLLKIAPIVHAVCFFPEIPEDWPFEDIIWPESLLGKLKKAYSLPNINEAIDETRKKEGFLVIAHPCSIPLPYGHYEKRGLSLLFEDNGIEDIAIEYNSHSLIYDLTNGHYLEIAKKNRSRVKVVSGAGDVEETWGKIREILDNFLSRN